MVCGTADWTGNTPAIRTVVEDPVTVTALDLEDVDLGCPEGSKDTVGRGHYCSTRYSQ